MAYSEREVIRISEDLEIPGLLRADLERELSAFEMGMRLKGAELIYIPDPAIDPAGEAQRVPYRL
ncbi:hypothetical protein, partial [Klebsiella michiganensis]|uniref:hypothetical protein n=1 Tax=Klebsiella michiganensis TaxID=1134687 RepID=UPI001954228D